MHQLQRRQGLYIFQMSQNGVCIRSVFEQKIGPYKVCILVNMGPYGKVAALPLPPHWLLAVQKTAQQIIVWNSDNHPQPG